MASISSTGTVCGMARRDIDDVVAVHMRSFPGFFLSKLGAPFLLLLYRELLNDPSGIALVSKHNEEVQGFVAGTTEPKGFYRRLLTGKWISFARASLVPALRHPSFLPRLLQAFRKTGDEAVNEGCGLLMSIAVDPQCQTRGIGTGLVHGFLAECRQRGLSSVHLTTDRSENDRTNRFYLKLGFTVSSITTTPQGRSMNDYRIEL
jgi:ribosomal protein S18 acetylase RimI-like enzyme